MRVTLLSLLLALVALKNVAAFTGSCQPAFARRAFVSNNGALSMSAVAEAPPASTSSSEALGDKIRNIAVIAHVDHVSSCFGSVAVSKPRCCSSK